MLVFFVLFLYALILLFQSDMEKTRKILFLQTQVFTLQGYIASLPLQNKPRFIIPVSQKFILAFLSKSIEDWKRLFFIFQPDTLIKWHRNLFRLFWKIKSSAKNKRKKISQEIIDLIRDMAENTSWGAERIRGEILKLGRKVCKRTVQKYMRNITRPFHRLGGSWKTFLKNHNIFAVDFQVIYNTINFEIYYVIYFLDQSSRKIIHFNATQHPVKSWITQQVREAFPFIDEKVFLIHDNDDKLKYINYRGLGIEPVKTSFQAPKCF